MQYISLWDTIIQYIYIYIYIFFLIEYTSTGSLRLAGGSVPGEGRVEILGESEDWGTICDDGWDKTDAGVACRQLGYPDALEAIVNVDNPNTQPVFGSGSGPILLDGLDCESEKRHLRDCLVTKEWGIHDCTHGEDAGIKCDMGRKFLLH